MSLRIRRASASDADALSAISRDTFVETFGHLYKPEDLAWHLDFSYAAEKYRDALEEQGAVAWLLEGEAGDVQGYAFAGPCGLPHEDVQPGDMELKRLYLRRSLQNGGWGAKLFAEAEDWMRRNGPAAIWIGVWSENPGAQRFYARHGYEKAGEYFYPVGEARDLEFIFKKSLVD
ncbi:GNAT family N-acetyltransferase [Solilutibacter tolerans]|uniref:Protein N-acetyltransferase, RimJ/RimL family n=1 Tax=Solilutibacter tolerans TaxID=1604334 RepID=A0A1N6NGJ6_9GAMM|nr:GNAT family N-acetyltransferase [Lysobacter tolerans]SIP91106.1 Protein N-acetyltransferase, RimJ/RimL family [Lysobacter tolerans]